MTPEQLADAYADASFEQGLNQRTVDPEPEKRREALVTELRRLAAENAALRKDAERYRWLRDKGDSTWMAMGRRPGVKFTQEIDAAIDAAM
jgi:hypothetical protein